MKVFVGCEYSGTVREAFNRGGHYAESCDLLPTEKPGRHYQDDIFHVMHSSTFGYKDLMIFHPPCTYLTNSGVRWLFDKNGARIEERWQKLEDAVIFFRALKNSNCDRIALENPIPHKYARDGFYNYKGEWVEGIGQYTQLIQPWQFGHTTSKATCLWLKGLPSLEPTKIIPKAERTFEIHKASPGPDRWKVRSKTFEGIAQAMADQWGIE